MRAAAVAAGASIQLLAGAVGLEEAPLTEAIREAVREHVLVADGDSVTFRHPLLQEAAYGELCPARARGCTRACARRSRSAGAGRRQRATVAAEIAHHWLHAGDRPRALGACVRAGLRPSAPTRARGRRPPGPGARLWDAVPDARERAGLERGEVLARAAEAAAWSGSPSRRSSSSRRARSHRRRPRPGARRAPARAPRLRPWWCGRGADGLLDYEAAVGLTPSEPPSADRARSSSPASASR